MTKFTLVTIGTLVALAMAPTSTGAGICDPAGDLRGDYRSLAELVASWMDSCEWETAEVHSPESTGEDILERALGAADEFCPGAGSAWLSWSWYVNVIVLDIQVEEIITDPHVTGLWGTADMDGQEVGTGDAWGRLGELHAVHDAGTVQVYPLAPIPAHGVLENICQEVPLVPDLPIGAAFDYAGAINIPSAYVEVGAQGVLCVVPLSC